MSNVTSFTGDRVGPTPADIEEFNCEVDKIAAELKSSDVFAFAITILSKANGTEQSRSDWMKKPGVGLAELVGGAAILQRDIIESMPEVE